LSISGVPAIVAVLRQVWRCWRSDSRALALRTEFRRVSWRDQQYEYTTASVADVLSSGTLLPESTPLPVLSCAFPLAAVECPASASGAVRSMFGDNLTVSYVRRDIEPGRGGVGKGCVFTTLRDDCSE
jgi:hypothetical protein